jgi:single-strand DNA-binding protein
MNLFIATGNLTRDPEIKYTPSGAAVGKLGMAINEKYRTKDGEKKEEVCFVDIEIWGAAAENCGKYLKKGSKVLVEGSLKLDQ